MSANGLAAVFLVGVFALIALGMVCCTFGG
jgi:hypothetical protein